MSKKSIIILCAISALLLIVGVPLLINECYKVGGYITLWDAKDTLSYYGTILGSLVSVLVLAATILFTRKQIVHEQHMKTLDERWKNVDSIMTRAIEIVDPLSIVQIVYADMGYQHAGDTIYKLQTHIMKMKSSLDSLVFHLNADELQRVEKLSQDILSCMSESEKLANEYSQQLSNVLSIEMRKNHEELLRMASQSPHLVTLEKVKESQEFLNNTPSIPLDTITAEIGNIGIKLIELHNTAHKTLYSTKRDIFRDISEENQQNASNLLYFYSGRKK